MVAERQAGLYGQDAGEIAERDGGARPNQLGDVGVALVRQHGAAGGIAIADAGEAVVRGRPRHQVGGEAREVHEGRRCGGGQLDGIVTIRDRVEAVGRDAAEAEPHGHRVAVDSEAAPHRGARTGGRGVDASRGVREAPPVAIEHLEVRQQVMGEEHRLSGLRMRMRREDRVEMLLGATEQGLLEAAQACRRGGRRQPSATAARRSRPPRSGCARPAAGRRARGRLPRARRPRRSCGRPRAVRPTRTCRPRSPPRFAPGPRRGARCRWRRSRPADAARAGARGWRRCRSAPVADRRRSCSTARRRRGSAAPGRGCPTAACPGTESVSWTHDHTV